MEGGMNGSEELEIQGLLTATVTLAETQEKNKKPVYKIVVHNETRSSVVHKKFSDFQALYDKLKRLFPSAHLKLPTKKFFGSNDNKLEGLNDFLYKICSNRYIYMTSMVTEFLELQNLKVRTKFTEEDVYHDSSSDQEQNGQTRVNLGPSEKLHGKARDFEFLKVIGKGSFGRVLLARHKAEDKIYAVKVLNKSHIIKKNETKHIMSERNVLIENVQHPFLVGLHYSFQSADKLYFVLDYVNGGELFYHLQKERSFPEVRGRFYAAEICSALAYLHSLNIIYRDLKPENILLDCEGHVVLTDFGLCKEGVKGGGTTSTFCGTPEYLAPEVLRKQPYDMTVDWWCLGCVLYEMLFGLPPFYSRDTGEMYQNIMYKDLTFKPNVVSLEAQHFLEKLLNKKKELRLGAHSDSLEVKRHPFFSQINWTLLDERKVVPPYNPNVDGEMDLKHFDPEFVREPVPASVGKSFHDRYGGNAAGNLFEGFSYVPPAEHLQA